MIIDLENLPSEITLLHQIITDLVEQMTSLEEQLALLKARRFGKSSEKLNKQIDELEHRIEENEFNEALEDASNNESVKEDVATKASSKGKHSKRQKLPDHLERTDIVIPAPSSCPSCGGLEFRNIANDKSEILEYIPSSFKVIRSIRPRCACTSCDQIVQGYAPGNTIDKGKAGPGLLAHILVQKYCNHLPIYRQSQMYEREGVELARSTMTSWAGQCAVLLSPLIEELRSYVFSASHIHGDDTPVKVLAPGLGQTKTGRIWSYVRDGRPYGDVNPPAVCYFYSPDRRGERPAEHLKTFKGVLHADAYAGYDKLYISDSNLGAQITGAGCWAHTRRKFYEVTVASDNANIAINALEEIGKIYQIEEAIRGLEPSERIKKRREESKELVEKLFVSFKKSYGYLSKKSITAKAIAYALNNREALMRFLDDGKIEIDNNTAERAMRSIAVGRKNWLFAGADTGGHTAASMYSLIETAKLCSINPWQYLKTVLATIQDHPISKIYELLPWNIMLQ